MRVECVDLECLRNECGQSVAALQIADIYGLFDCRSASDTVASYLTLALDTAARSQNAFLQIKNQFRVDKKTKQQILKQNTYILQLHSESHLMLLLQLVQQLAISL